MQRVLYGSATLMWNWGVAQYGWDGDQWPVPENYINKGEARKLGWESKKGNLSKVAPGKSIGEIYTKTEKNLSEAKNRVWCEADINYIIGYRGNGRLFYSNDGLIYITTDHYKTFVKLK